MPRREKGCRVGAILSASKEKGVKFLGFGVYEGDFVPHEGAAGWMTQTSRLYGNHVPRIRLDNGRVVYGPQCWWGSEQEVQRQLEHFGNVEHVTLEDDPIDPERRIVNMRLWSRGWVAGMRWRGLPKPHSEGFSRNHHGCYDLLWQWDHGMVILSVNPEWAIVYAALKDEEGFATSAIRDLDPRRLCEGLVDLLLRMAQAQIDPLEQAELEALVRALPTFCNPCPVSQEICQHEGRFDAPCEASQP